MTIPDLPPEGLPLPGADRYILRKLLGRGGFGDAYLADDQELTRRVVIKLLMNLNDPSIRDRFKREARISANIRHPAVVQVFDIGSLPDGRPYFIMEWIDGTSLTQFVNERGRTLSLSKALTLIAEASEGLAVAHKMGVIHRDIKPDNILVTRDGHAKLIDFGIAKKAVQETEATPTMKQTSMGTVLGTPRYISPEQATAKVLAAASDLYSLGCVMYTLLTSRSPFDGNPQELMMHHVYTPAPPLSASAPDRRFPPEVEGIVARLLAKDPLRRYQTGEELAQALRRCAEQAKTEEESDATSALPTITEQNQPPGTPTISNIQSAPQPAIVAPSARAARFATSEGAATAALPMASSVPMKDDSLSSRMPVSVMEGNLTGTTQTTRPSRTIGLVLGALLLVVAAAGGTGIYMKSQSSSPTSASTPVTAPTPTPTTVSAAPATGSTVTNPPETAKQPEIAAPPTTETASASVAGKATSAPAKPPPATTNPLGIATTKPPSTATGGAPTTPTPPKPSATTAPTPKPTAVLDDDRL
jgi:serine/threonine protein kinase